jgi:hypothetical protein
MYVTAAAGKVMRLSGVDIGLEGLLILSRWLSVLVTVLTIWGIAVLGHRLFDTATGLAAAALFAFSPFVLHFGHDALTQGDAFAAGAVVLALIAAERFDARRTTRSLAFLALSIGLAAACKFTLGFLVPALLSFQLLRRVAGRVAAEGRSGRPGGAPPGRALSRRYIALAWATFFGVAIAVILALGRFGLPSTARRIHTAGAMAAWLVSLLGILASFILATRRPERDIRWSIAWGWVAIVPLAIAACLSLFPAHIFNPDILPVLFERFTTRDGNTALLATALVSAKLYLGIVLLKLGLPLGIATCVALAWAVWKSPVERGLLLTSVVLGWYALLILTLPLQQPFWLMSVYPLITLVLAAMLARALSKRRSVPIRLTAAVAVTFGVAWLAVGIVRVYPTFEYYGYEWTGDRWLGEPARGYRSLVVVTNDGSTEALDWLRDNAPRGSIVLSYLNDVHIIRYLADTHAYPFDLRLAPKYADDESLAADLARAAFVVVRGVDDEPRRPQSEPVFAHRFSSDPAHEIVRGRGVYRTAVVRIFRAREPS